MAALYLILFYLLAHSLDSLNNYGHSLSLTLQCIITRGLLISLSTSVTSPWVGRRLVSSSGMSSLLSSPYPIPNTHTLLPIRGVMEGGFAKPWQEALQDMTGCRCLLDINLAPSFLGSPEMTAASFLKYFSPLYDFLEQENEKAGACIGIASSYFSLKSFSHQKH